MRKVRLNVNELRVETFKVDSEPVERGTVHGHGPGTMTFVCCTGGGGCTQVDSCSGPIACICDTQDASCYGVCQ